MTMNPVTTIGHNRAARHLSPVPTPDPASVLESVLKSCSCSFDAGKILKLEGGIASTIYCVLDGWLSLSKSTENGQRQIIDFVLPGDIVNPAAADKRTSAVQIACVSPTRVSIVPAASWARLLDKVPMLERREGLILSSTVARLSERMLRLGQGTAEMRIAYCLIELYLRLGAIGQVDGGRFHIPVTQRQLGEFAGLSSVHVCRTMRNMTQRQILTADGHMHVTILDLEALSRIAGVDLGTLMAQIIPAD